MPRVPRRAMRIGGPGMPCPYVFAVAERESTRTIFLGAFLVTGAYWNQLAMYSSSTRRRTWICLRLASTRFRFFPRYQKAFNEVCSHNMQHMTTITSRAVMENQLRQ